MIGIAAKEFHVAEFDRAAAPDLAHHARHRCLRSIARGDGGGIVGVDAVERGGKTVGIAFAADFAVGHDVDAGPFHVADRDDGGVVLRFLQMFGRQPPHRMHARARHDLRQHRAIDQPFRLRVASDHRGRQQVFRQVHSVLPVYQPVIPYLQRLGIEPSYAHAGIKSIFVVEALYTLISLNPILTCETDHIRLWMYTIGTQLCPCWRIP